MVLKEESASVLPLVVMHDEGLGLQWHYEGIETHAVGGGVDNVIAGCEWHESATGVRCEWSIANTGESAVKVSEICVKFRLVATEELGKVFFQSWTMNGATGLRQIGAEERSSGVMGWSDAGGSCAAMAGFLDHSKANGWVTAGRIDEKTWRVTAIISREGRSLAPGEVLVLSPLLLRTGAKLSVLLGQQAEAVAAFMGERAKKPAESGWCSWYYFYGKETFEQVAFCAEELANLPLAHSLRTIQIDDGWNRESAGNLPDSWGDWEAHPDKFPDGMAAAAQRIHDLGFRAGLWLAPFAVARKSRFFVEHPDWLVQQRDPETGILTPAPTNSPDIFQLDCTHPLALNWLRETFQRVFSEWSFDYIKIDFLHYGAMEGGVRQDSAATSVDAYRRGLQAINEVATTDKFILGCGAPLLASVGLVDGMRVGPDVGGRWAFDPGWPDWPVGNCSLRAAAIPSLWSQWMHGHLWQNDPDCLVVRDTPTRYESDALGRFEQEVELNNPNYQATSFGLTAEEAGLWVRLVWMTGGMALLSEVWGELPASRQEMLAKCFPAHGRKVSVLDWYEAPDAAVLIASGKPVLAGVFNFGDTSCRVEISAAKMGLSGCWTLRERWSGDVLRGEGDVVVFPELPAHSGQVWESV